MDSMDKPFHTTLVNEAFKKLGSSPNGLTVSEATDRLKQFGSPKKIYPNQCSSSEGW